jgi:hypothetical protein
VAEKILSGWQINGITTLQSGPPLQISGGNAPRLMPNLRGLGVWNFDVPFFKNVRASERFRLQFRSEFFNIFNTPQFGLPNTNFNAPHFAAVASQVNAPRDIQFALKILF